MIALGMSSTVKAVSPLDNDALMRVAPSIFAGDKHESRSDRYTYIPTINILDALRKENFLPFQAFQTRVRDSNKVEHTKHLVRLRHMNRMDQHDSNEILLINSHDGSSSYQMMGGVYRLVCSNGMVIGKTLNEVRIPHKGEIVSQVIEGAYTVLDDFESIDEAKDGMKSITLSNQERIIFAEQALSLRYEEQLPVSPAQILRPRRTLDETQDLWTTFNVVQENLVRGGLVGRTRSGSRTRTRAVNGIDQNVKLNRALWTLAEKMRELKS